MLPSHTLILSTRDATLDHLDDPMSHNEGDNSSALEQRADQAPHKTEGMPQPLLGAEEAPQLVEEVSPPQPNLKGA